MIDLVSQVSRCPGVHIADTADRAVCTVPLSAGGREHTCSFCLGSVGRLTTFDGMMHTVHRTQQDNTDKKAREDARNAGGWWEE